MCSNQLSYVATLNLFRFNMVRKKRLELLRLAAPEPKSGASTNFATSANCIDNLIAQIIDVMAGLLGFEPRYDGIKTRCLTAWRQTYRIRYIWCGRRDLNPHVLRTLTPEASASTNSATTALNASNCNMVATTGFEPVTPSL